MINEMQIASLMQTTFNLSESQYEHYILGNREIPDWMQKYIDKGVIKYIQNCGGIVDVMKIKIQNGKHMKPLYTYEGDIFTKLSNNKIKIYRNRGVLPDDDWLVEFSI